MAPRCRARFKRLLNILRNFQGQLRRRIIASISWRAVQSSRHQSPDRLKLRIPLAIDSGPPAVGSPRRELAGVTRIIQTLDQTIDPSEAERFIEGVLVSDRG